jgi:hypothetical protein
MHSGAATGRGRAWRLTSLSAAVLAVCAGVGGSVALADEPDPGEIVVEVGLPPVPPTTVVVEVGTPPVPPTTVVVEAVVEVGLPPVPPTEPLPEPLAEVELPPLPDTFGADTTGDVTGSIAGAIAATANAAWRDA